MGAIADSHAFEGAQLEPIDFTIYSSPLRILGL